MNFKDIKNNEEVIALLDKGNKNLKTLGYTDHSSVHCEVVAKRAAGILEDLKYDKHTVELVKIAGYLHDIGNAINRSHHAEYGAIIAGEILRGMDISIEDRVTIMSAIGHHDESTGGANDVISAALIIADKSDVRRDRVNEKNKSEFDIHDKVNYAVTSSKLRVDKDKKIISLNLQVDEKICSMYDYFDIFLGRMLMCRAASELLGMKFKLSANGRKIL